ncbi:MAG: hypothetical protein B1H07_02650 [Campylobacteraceae bacterium 4484_166]|nr:MAG: hypothetical protein B1H07_02650 [Campylobacteraceae bacterium 4484_166]
MKIRFSVFLWFLLSVILYANIDKKIEENKERQQNINNQKRKTTKQIKNLVWKIHTTTKKAKKLKLNIKIESNLIEKNRAKVRDSKKELKELKKTAKDIQKAKTDIEIKIAKTLASNYITTIATKLTNQKSIDEILDTYVYKILSIESKRKVSLLSVRFDEINNKENIIKKRIAKIVAVIEKDKIDRRELTKKTKQLKKTKQSLKQKHKSYQKKLAKIVQEQKKLSSILDSLNIVKQEQLKKPDESSIANDEYGQDRFSKNIAMNVKSIGYSSYGVKTTRYRGKKTIAPLKSYTITKTFGERYDKVYKIKLFNDSITLKTKVANAKVLSVFDGKVVYSKHDSQLLENVVIIKHKNNIHTIYSHLDKIAPNIKKGKWLKKGATIGRVKNSIGFQATKNSKYLNPKELF